MGMNYGTITGVDIDTNKDGTEQVRLLTVEVYENDPITVELRAEDGEDYVPAVGSICFFGEVTESYAVGLATGGASAPDETIQQGERELYSHENGTRKAKVRLKKDGHVVVNDGGGVATEHGRMEIAFNQLRDDVNALANIVTTHVHPGVTPGPGSTAVTVTPATPSSASMANAKSDTVEIP
jgi:hypothetical protein